LDPAKYPTLPSRLNSLPAGFAKLPDFPIGYTLAGWMSEPAAWITGAANTAELANARLRSEVLDNPHMEAC